MRRVGPRTGDWVRAVTHDRDAVTVEGKLDLRLHEGLLHRRVSVVVLNGELAHDVVPESIEVLQPSGLSLELLEAGWEVFDLESARSHGLLAEPRKWVGGTWAEMFARLDLLVAPLLVAGWEICETARDQSCGDDWTIYLLQRNGTRIDVELSDNGWIDVWDISRDPDEDNDVDPVPPTFQTTLDYDIFVIECNLRGWLAD